MTKLERNSGALKPLPKKECGEIDELGWTCVRPKSHPLPHRGYPCPCDRCSLQAGHMREGLECVIDKKRPARPTRRVPRESVDVEAAVDEYVRTVWHGIFAESEQAEELRKHLRNFARYFAKEGA